MRHIRMTTAFLFVLFAAGCADLPQYYEITDPTSGRRYVTDDWVALKYNMNGALDFNDLCTGKEVVLQSSEVRKIGHDEANMDIAEKGDFTQSQPANPMP